MATSHSTEEWLTKKELFAILHGYPSSLEVQYMIDQSLDKLAATTPAGAERPGPSVSTTADAHAPQDTQSSEWMEILVRAKVEADLEQRLPALIEAEVQRQLRLQPKAKDSADATAAPRGRERGDVQPSASPSPLRAIAPPRSPPPGERPPLPPGASPPRKAVDAHTSDKERVEGRGEDVENKDDDEEGVGPHLGPHAFNETAVATSTRASVATTVSSADAARQRARILETIQDVEHQVKSLQRQVNELSHQTRTQHQRMGRFWTALTPPNWKSSTAPHHSTAPLLDAGAAQAPALNTTAPGSPAQVELSGTSTSTASQYGAFYAALLEALDAGETEPVRALLEEVIVAVCRVPAPPNEPDVLSTSTTATPPPKQQPVPARASSSGSISHGGAHLEEDNLDTSQRSPSALRQSPIIPVPLSTSLNDSVDSHGGDSTTAAPTGFVQGVPQAVLPLYMRHTAPPRRAEQLPSQSSPSSRTSPATAASATLQLGVDAVDIPGGLLPSSLGLRGGGVRVLSVVPGQLAERSGLRPGDVVLQVLQTPVETCAQLRTALRSVRAHDLVPVEVYRHSVQMLLTITLIF